MSPKNAPQQGEKKPYKTPRLHVYGKVPTLTLGPGVTGSPDRRGSTTRTR